MITLDDALGRLEESVGCLPSEEVRVEKGGGRVLREDLHARSRSPVEPIAAMDGYAVNASAVADGVPLKVVGQAAAGGTERLRIEFAQAVRIFTGGMIPHGSDCVVMQEYARCVDGYVRFAEGHGPARHIREAGSDFVEGVRLVAAGTRLGPRQMVLCSAADVSQITVTRAARIGILATGDELAAPGTAQDRTGAIPESTSLAIAEMATLYGGNVVERIILGDDFNALRRAARKLVEHSDLLIILGGASVGERDLAKELLRPFGLKWLFDKVAIKPGKPVWSGVVGETVVLGLPGNPSSALVTARLLLPPILELLHGATPALQWRPLPVAASLPRIGNRETFLRARWSNAGLVPLDDQSSGSQLALGQADYLIRCAADQDQRASGTIVPALLF